MPKKIWNVPPQTAEERRQFLSEKREIIEHCIDRNLTEEEISRMVNFQSSLDFKEIAKEENQWGKKQQKFYDENYKKEYNDKIKGGQRFIMYFLDRSGTKEADAKNRKFLDSLTNEKGMSEFVQKVCRDLLSEDPNVFNDQDNGSMIDKIAMYQNHRVNINVAWIAYDDLLTNGDLKKFVPKNVVNALAERRKLFQNSGYYDILFQLYDMDYNWIWLNLKKGDFSKIERNGFVVKNGRLPWLSGQGMSAEEQEKAEDLESKLYDEQNNASSLIAGLSPRNNRNGIRKEDVAAWEKQGYLSPYMQAYVDNQPIELYQAMQDLKQGNQVEFRLRPAEEIEAIHDLIKGSQRESDRKVYLDYAIARNYQIADKEKKSEAAENSPASVLPDEILDPDYVKEIKGLSYSDIAEHPDRMPAIRQKGTLSDLMNKAVTYYQSIHYRSAMKKYGLDPTNEELSKMLSKSRTFKDAVTAFAANPQNYVKKNTDIAARHLAELYDAVHRDNAGKKEADQYLEQFLNNYPLPRLSDKDAAKLKADEKVQGYLRNAQEMSDYSRKQQELKKLLVSNLLYNIHASDQHGSSRWASRLANAPDLSPEEKNRLSTLNDRTDLHKMQLADLYLQELEKAVDSELIEYSTEEYHGANHDKHLYYGNLATDSESMWNELKALKVQIDPQDIAVIKKFKDYLCTNTNYMTQMDVHLLNPTAEYLKLEELNENNKGDLGDACYKLEDPYAKSVPFDNEYILLEKSKQEERKKVGEKEIEAYKASLKHVREAIAAAIEKQKSGDLQADGSKKASRKQADNVNPNPAGIVKPAVHVTGMSEKEPEIINEDINTNSVKPQETGSVSPLPAKTCFVEARRDIITLRNEMDVLVSADPDMSSDFKAFRKAVKAAALDYPENSDVLKKQLNEMIAAARKYEKAKDQDLYAKAYRFFHDKDAGADRFSGSGKDRYKYAETIIRVCNQHLDQLNASLGEKTYRPEINRGLVDHLKSSYKEKIAEHLRHQPDAFDRLKLGEYIVLNRLSESGHASLAKNYTGQDLFDQGKMIAESPAMKNLEKAVKGLDLRMRDMYAGYSAAQKYQKDLDRFTNMNAEEQKRYLVNLKSKPLYRSDNSVLDHKLKDIFYTKMMDSFEKQHAVKDESQKVRSTEILIKK